MIKVYYNQKCAICNFEISHYKKKNIACFNWIDVSVPSKDLNILNKSPKELIRRLHVIDDNKVYAGASAFIVLWKNMPKYRVLSNFLNLPIVFHFFYVFYEIIAFFLYIKNKHQINDGLHK
tara:strand:- start:466 stop:828 length:363 start_codon:yes stop_codon:yes gene_type:complete